VNFNLSLFLPELFQLMIILLLFLQALAKPKLAQQVFTKTTIFTNEWVPLAAGFSVIISLISLSSNGQMFYGTYQLDGLSQFFKFVITVGFVITTLNAIKQPTMESNQQADYFMLMSLSVLGLMFLSSSVELVTIYLSLEISSYSLFAIIPIRGNDSCAAEAGIKYILFGAAATAIALYGLALILSTEHTTYLSILSQRKLTWGNSSLTVIGFTLFMVGFFYKLALFPFHFWCPDVYDGTSNETAAYTATLPKLGAVVILIRLAAMLRPWMEVTLVLAILGAASMTFGNLAALTQKDLKRILGYSSVAHAGYVIVGLVGGNSKGFAAAAFYSLVYILMNLTAFWVICRLSIDGRNLQLNDLNGLYKKAPCLAFILAVAVFGLVGLPPTAGFMGKLFLLSAAWGYGYDWLIIIAAVNTAIAIYYYLNIVRHAYTVDDVGDGFFILRTNSKIWGGILAAIVLILGISPSFIFKWAECAGRQLIMMP